MTRALALALLLATTLPAFAQDADPFAEIFKQMRARWSAIQKADEKTADACAAGAAPRMSFVPATIYPDAIGITASASGAVAIADLKQNRILVYPDGPDHEPFKLPLGGMYSDRTQMLSEDGRYFAYNAGGGLTILDLVAKKTAFTSQILARAIQWMGHDLFVMQDNLLPNQGSNILLRQTEDDFRVETLPEFKIKPGTPPSPEREGHYAISDQLGRSFLRGDKLYADITVAAADGAILLPATPSQYEGSLYRSGDRLFQIEREDTPVPGNTPRVSRTLVLRDGTTGAKISTRTLPHDCFPQSVAAVPDGGGFLMQTGLTVMLLDKDDLHVKAVYRLMASPLAFPKSITLLPGNRLLTSTELPYPEPSPVLIYNLSAPMPQ